MKCYSQRSLSPSSREQDMHISTDVIFNMELQKQRPMLDLLSGLNGNNKVSGDVLTSSLCDALSECRQRSHSDYW